MPGKTVGLLVETASGPGALHEITGVIARHKGDIALVEILERGPDTTRFYLELELPADHASLVDELQESMMQVRMLPVGVLFSKFPRLVRDLARGLGKDVRLVVEGNEHGIDVFVVVA